MKNEKASTPHTLTEAQDALLALAGDDQALKDFLYSDAVAACLYRARLDEGQGRFSRDSVKAASMILADCIERGKTLDEGFKRAVGRLIPLASLTSAPVAYLYEAEGFADAFSKRRLPMEAMAGSVKETPLYAFHATQKENYETHPIA